MYWISQGPRILRVAGGFAVGVSAVVLSVDMIRSEDRNGTSMVTLPLDKVRASWTTNFTPSTEWDMNWDRYLT